MIEIDFMSSTFENIEKKGLDTFKQVILLFNSGDAFLAKEKLDLLMLSAPGIPLLADVLVHVDFAYHTAMANAWFPGVNYLGWLEWFHDTLKPETYAEIGVESGQSLSLARPSSFAVGVDPGLAIVHQQRAWVRLFKMPSDCFFDENNLNEIFGGRPAGLSFIDGLHTFDQALRDFINLEAASSRESVILFHDVYPVVPETALRDRNTTLWLGDTWKVVLILRALRPDLQIFTIPAFPSGLTVVTNLDPFSTLLLNRHDAVVDEWMGVRLEDYFDDLSEHLGVVENDFATVAEILKV